HRLSHRGADGHRRRPAAQSGEVGHRGITTRRAMPRPAVPAAWRSYILGCRLFAGRRANRMSDHNQAGGTPPSGAKGAPGIMSRIRTYFLTGLIVAGPVAITLWLIWWFVTWVDSLVRPLLPATYQPEIYLPFHIPGLGLIFAFDVLTLLGFLTANFVGRRLVSFGDSILNRMPIVRPIYRTAKQIFQTLFSASESSFRRVGLVEFPSPGMWSLVFLTQAPS